MQKANDMEVEIDNAVEVALMQVAGNVRWQNAFRRAARMIEAGALMHWTGETLLVWSESGELYEASEQGCQCKAFTEGFPCKHRAAYQLVKRLNEVAM